MLGSFLLSTSKILESSLNGNIGHGGKWPPAGIAERWVSQPLDSWPAFAALSVLGILFPLRWEDMFSLSKLAKASGPADKPRKRGGTIGARVAASLGGTVFLARRQRPPPASEAQNDKKTAGVPSLFHRRSPAVPLKGDGGGKTTGRTAPHSERRTTRHRSRGLAFMAAQPSKRRSRSRWRISAPADDRESIRLLFPVPPLRGSY